jgi:SAM-dependent methyltransferase
MSLAFMRHAEISPEQIARLKKAMADFYQNTPASYYAIADQSARRYNTSEQPFHYDLVGRVFPGATVLEAGCGTAHLCSYIEERGGIYTGLDYSEILLQKNRQHFPRARFFQIGAAPSETFDIVASLYTIEHVVDPPAYLESLWNFCKPGGLIAIICPEFIDSPGFPLSVFLGKTPRRFREKISALDLPDAASHLLDLKLRAPRMKKILQASPPGAFWMNLHPSVLHGAEYAVDADAIHLARLKDLIWFFQQKGAEILQTSSEMPGLSPDVLQYNCYLLARKPSLAAKAVEK